MDSEQRELYPVICPECHRASWSPYRMTDVKGKYGSVLHIPSLQAPGRQEAHPEEVHSQGQRARRRSMSDHVTLEDEFVVQRGVFVRPRGYVYACLSNEC